MASRASAILTSSESGACSNARPINASASLVCPRANSAIAWEASTLAAAAGCSPVLASAATSNADYDGELRGASFFDAGKFPRATYNATKFRALGGNRYAADGTLTLRGISKPVVLEFTWTPGAAPVLAGKATVKRLAFGVGGGDWADTALIPDAIAISTKVAFKAK